MTIEIELASDANKQKNELHVMVKLARSIENLISLIVPRIRQLM